MTVGGTVAAGDISGSGSTTVDGSLTADSIVQNTLTIGAGGSVTIRETAGGARQRQRRARAGHVGVDCRGGRCAGWPSAAGVEPRTCPSRTEYRSVQMDAVGLRPTRMDAAEAASYEDEETKTPSSPPRPRARAAGPSREAGPTKTPSAPAGCS